MVRWNGMAFAAAVLAAMLQIVPAAAQGTKDWARCKGDDGAPADLQTRACTTIIQTGGETPKDLALAFKSRGTAYFGMHDYEHALQDYDQSIARNPADPEALDNRCWTRATVGRLNEALGDCNESLRIRPDYDDTMDTRGFVYLRLGKFKEAIADYDAALRSEPSVPYSLYGRGFAKSKLGDTDGGNADIAAAQAIKKDIAEEMAGYGLQ